MGKPNIVLFSLDACRADHLGCYGYSRDTSPNIDRIAEQSVVFENAYSQAPSTWTSVPATLTGCPIIMPWNVESRRFLSNNYSLIKYRDGSVRLLSIPDILADHHHTTMLPKLLELNGYNTYFINTNYLLELQSENRRAYGFPRGNMFHRTEWEYNQVGDNAWAKDCYDEFMKRFPNLRRPFFLYVHLMNPHAPWNVPKQFNPFGCCLKAKYNEYAGTEYEKTIARDCYDNSIYYADHYTGKIFEEVKKDPDNVFILTSDHGEDILDHGSISHVMVFNSVTHVPLMLYSRFHSPQQISRFVELIDIYPTILDICEVQHPKGIVGVNLFESRKTGAFSQLSTGQDKYPVFSYRDSEHTYIYAPENAMVVQSLFKKYLKGFKHWLYDKDDTLISNDADHPTVVRLYELVQKHIDKNMVKTEKKYAINHKQTWNRLHAEGYEGYTRNIVDLVRQLPENFLREDWCVLDIGCGAGYHMEYMAQRVREVYGVDISIKAVEIAVKRLSKFDNVYVYEGTGDSLNMFPDNTFDFVYSMATFQHIPKAFTENYLKETLRCLKPNGKMLFHVIHRLNPEENKGDIGLIKNEETRGYDKETLREMVAKSGLKLDKIIRQKLGRRGNQLEWLWAWCSK